LTYLGIADDLAARIKAGEYTLETGLPSYSSIAEIYDVSRSTAQAAVRVLRMRGLVEGHQGKGVYPVE
jgi:DNA-binding GntR family transcriptional regulator